MIFRILVETIISTRCVTKVKKVFIYYRTWFAVQQWPEMCKMDQDEIEMRKNLHPHTLSVQLDSERMEIKLVFNSLYCFPNMALRYGFPDKVFSNWKAYDLVTY